MAKTEERNPLVDPETLEREIEEEGSLRPRTLTEYVGQERVKESLAVFIEAARKRGEALDHVLLSGPPGSRKDDPGLHPVPGDGRQHQGDIGPRH